MNRSDSRFNIEDWIHTELREYADVQKWDRDDVNHTTWDEPNAEWWDNFAHQYLHRARTLGFTNPLGQQALLKTLVTLFEMCVTMDLALHGKIPMPGHASGEIVFEGD